MQNYCRDLYSHGSVNVYWREEPNDNDDYGWGNHELLYSSHLIKSDKIYYNQYRISGKILFTNKDHDYYFRLTTKTPAKIKIGNKGTIDKTERIHCNPYDSQQIEYHYGKPSTLGQESFTIIIDTGCSINTVDALLEWNFEKSDYSAINMKYLST